jgi:hypothetical protein
VSCCPRIFAGPLRVLEPAAVYLEKEADAPVLGEVPAVGSRLFSPRTSVKCIELPVSDLVELVEGGGHCGVHLGRFAAHVPSGDLAGCHLREQRPEVGGATRWRRALHVLAKC